MNDTSNGLHDRPELTLSSVSRRVLAVGPQVSFTAKEAGAIGKQGEPRWKSRFPRRTRVIRGTPGDNKRTVWRLHDARRDPLPHVEERGACESTLNNAKQKQTDVRGQMRSSCVRAAACTHASPDFHARRDARRPEEETAPLHSLVRRIFMAPFLLLPPGFDILHAHLTLRTAHWRRNWQMKCGCCPLPRERATATVFAAYPHHIHIHEYICKSACERSLVERTIDLEPAGRFSKQTLQTRDFESA